MATTTHIVELTPQGFQIRHGGAHGNLGGGVWHSRWICQRAAEYLEQGAEIPKEYASARYLYAGALSAT